MEILKVFGLILVVWLMVAGCRQAEVVVPPTEVVTQMATVIESSPVAATQSPTVVVPAEAIFVPVAVFIPAGSFWMGAEAEMGLAICEESRAGCAHEDFLDEGPVREVTLDAYWIDKFEVSNADYRRCVEAGGCDLPALLEFYNHPGFAYHPVLYANWYQAGRYCQWVGGALPTEAQWEKARVVMMDASFPGGMF